MSAYQREAVMTEGEDVVIFLESQDDVGIIRTKLERVRGRRVALVVPPGTVALQRGIAIRLLRRVADGYGVDLSLITADGEVQRLAREEELRVFHSVRSFRRYAESAARPAAAPSPALLRMDAVTRMIVAGGSLVAMVLIVLILAFALIPSAKVTLQPATEYIGEGIEVRADPEGRSVDYVGRRVPARAIYDSVDGTDQVPVTGVGQSTEARAEGRVTFKNRTSQAVIIPAGTVVTAGAVKFVVQPSGNADGSYALAPAVGAWAQADVRAVDPGPKGALPRGNISAVEGPLAKQVDVFNEEPTAIAGAGGLGTVTESDRQRLHDQLYDRLSKEALSKLQSDVRSGETMPQQTVKVVVLQESYDRQVGDQARALNLRMQVRVNGTAFSQSDVENLAERAWQPRLRTGFAIVSDSVRLFPPEVVRTDGDVAVLRVRVDAIAAARIDEQQAAEAVRWRRAPDAVGQLARSFLLADQPRVVIEPSWAKRAFRVQVDVKNR